MKKTVLAVDLGAESGRVIAVHFDGSRLELEELHRFSNTPVMTHGTLYWDILRLWYDIQIGIKKSEKFKPAGIGVDTWGVDFALLDRHGNLLGNPVHYRDQRTDGVMENVFEKIPQKEIFRQTGIQFLPFNTIYQMVSLVQREAPELQLAETFLTVPDLINYWLTGEKCCEFSNATTTQLYNPVSGDWAHELIGNLNIPRHIFPGIIIPGTRIGRFNDIPVIAAACHDTGSAVAAVPAVSGNFAYISSGTWSLVGIEVRQPIISDKALQSNITNEGGVNNTFRLLKNVMGLWIVQQCRKTWQRQGETLSYAGLTRMAADAPSLKSVVNPNDRRFLVPGDHPSLLQEFCRDTAQAVPQSKGEIVRCVLESLACAYREVIETIESLTGQHIEKIHIVGGGTQNALLNQMTADVCNRTVVTGPIEATVIGNALVQFISLAEIKDLQQGRDLVGKLSEIKEYQPVQSSAWQEIYNKYRDL